MGRVDQYGVMGNPIAHSKSPQIHAVFARQTGQLISYRAILVEPDGFAAAVADFLASGGKGLNVTAPFKQEAFRIADVLSLGAERAGAANTLTAQSGRLCGENTDGAGLIRDLTVNLHIALSGRRILMLGAGGAARGVLGPLLDQRPSLLVVANRTVERARDLVARFAALGPVQACGFEALEGESFDLVINATAAGLGGEVPELPETLIGHTTRCYDMMYGSDPTAFVRYARSRGSAEAHDGLGMLVEQAAESFRIWRGVRPDARPVIDQLRQR